MNEQALKVIADTYNLDIDELCALVKTKCSMEEDTEEFLLKLSYRELQKRCGEKGLRRTGKKYDLIQRLLGREPAKTPTTVKRKKSTVLPRIRLGDDEVWHHEQTGLLMNKHKEVCNIMRNGKKEPLDKEAIRLCQQWTFKYKIPETPLSTETDEKEEVNEDQAVDKLLSKIVSAS